MLKIKKIILIIIIVVLLITIIVLKSKLNSEKYHDIEVEESSSLLVDNETKEPENSTCMVDVKGAVKNPGVYTTSCTDNVSDVIRLAGGLTENADTSVTNLAKKISNEMVVIIYTKEEVANSNIVDTVIKVVEGECICPNIQNDGCINDEITDTIGGDKTVNINSANIDELKTIPGIGEAKAKAIIEYRSQHGNFKSIEDIQNVSGIGNKLYEAIKAYITT